MNSLRRVGFALRERLRNFGRARRGHAPRQREESWTSRQPQSGSAHRSSPGRLASVAQSWRLVTAQPWIPGRPTCVQAVRRCQRVRLSLVLPLLALSTLIPAARAQPLAPADVPPALRPWIPWAMHGSEQQTCPRLEGTDAAPGCVWIGRLRLEASPLGGRFREEVELFTRDAVALPGDAQHWPLDVRDGAAAVAVVEHDGAPVVFLRARQPRAHRHVRLELAPLGARRSRGGVAGGAPPCRDPGGSPRAGRGGSALPAPPGP